MCAHPTARLPLRGALAAQIRASACPRARGNVRLLIRGVYRGAASIAEGESHACGARAETELQCGPVEFNAPVMSRRSLHYLGGNCPLRRPGVTSRWCRRSAPVAGVKVLISRWPLHIRRSLEYVDCVIGQPRYKAVVEMGQRPDAACRERALGLPHAFLLSCIVGPYDDLFVI